MLGENNPCWRGGMPKCKDCKKELPFRYRTRCNNCYRKFNKGENNPNWLGDKVDYFGLHVWLPKVLGRPTTCEECGRTGLKGHQIHWANRSGNYLRNVLDWIRLCAKCHKLYDKTYNVKRHSRFFIEKNYA